MVPCLMVPNLHLASRIVFDCHTPTANTVNFGADVPCMSRVRPRSIFPI